MENKTSGGGLSFLGLLTVAFIILKLCGVIGWSWVWILAPIWIPLAITAAVVAVCCIVEKAADYKMNKNFWENWRK